MSVLHFNSKARSGLCYSFSLKEQKPCEDWSSPWLRKKGVLSLAEVLPVCRRPWRAPWACSGVLAPWLKLGIIRLLSIPFLLDSDQLKVSVYCSLGKIARKPVYIMSVSSQTFHVHCFVTVGFVVCSLLEKSVRRFLLTHWFSCLGLVGQNAHVKSKCDCCLLTW